MAGCLLMILVGCGPPGEPAPLFVGHVAEQEGRAGSAAAHGIRLALAEQKDELLIALGGRPLLVRHTDTRGQASADEAEAVRLVTVNHAVGLIGGRTFEQVRGLDRAGVPVLSLLGSAPPGLSRLVFYTGVSPRERGQALGQYAAEDLKLTRVLLLLDTTSSEGAILADAFEQAFSQGGKTSFSRLRFDASVPAAELAKQVRQAASPALVFAGKPADLCRLRGELNGAVPTVIYAGDEVPTAALEAGRAAESLLAVTAFWPEDPSPKVQAFVKKYREDFKTEADVQALLGHDALRLLAEGLRRAQPDTRPEKLAEALRGIDDFAGLTGPLRIDAEQRLRRPLYVVRVEGTATTLRKRVAPGP